MRITVNDENETVTASVKCVICKRRIEFEVSFNGMNEYLDGALVQKAFPELDISYRELLISETCSGCFDAMFGEKNDS